MLQRIPYNPPISTLPPPPLAAAPPALPALVAHIICMRCYDASIKAICGLSLEPYDYIKPFMPLSS